MVALSGLAVTVRLSKTALSLFDNHLLYLLMSYVNLQKYKLYVDTQFNIRLKS